MESTYELFEKVFLKKTMLNICFSDRLLYRTFVKGFVLTVQCCQTLSVCDKSYNSKSLSDIINIFQRHETLLVCEFNIGKNMKHKMMEDPSWNLSQTILIINNIYQIIIPLQ